jgi:DNA-binding NarL/FixJ family response regulator
MTSIFLVEDHPIFAKMLLRFLRERGHLDVVSVATSAEDAIVQLQEVEVDLVLIDVSLPQRSGISLVFLLHKQFPDLPCVMLSGHLSSQYARRSLDAGARGYLLKDHADRILEGIQHVLNGEIYVSEELGNLDRY